MTTTKISINTINDVKNFVNIVTRCEYDVDIISGRYVIDAKSIMGIFSIDLTKPVTVSVNGTEEEYKTFREAVKDIIVED